MEKGTGTKFTACTAVRLSAATVSAENMSQRAIPAVFASLRQSQACVPRSNTYLQVLFAHSSISHSMWNVVLHLNQYADELSSTNEDHPSH